MTTDREELAANNCAVFMDRGPGLWVDYDIWIVARDRQKRRVLLGGLGAMGCGHMWVDESDYHAEYPGYDDASKLSAPDGGPW